MKNKILLDTSFLIPLNIAAEDKNTRAVEIMENTMHNNELYITNYIYLEYATIISQRLGTENLATAIRLLDKFNIKELFIDKELDNKIRNNYIRETKKDISYVDLSNFIICKKFNVDSIISFDNDFKYLGSKYNVKIIT